MAEKRLFWLKLKESFFTDKAMKKLRRMAGGDTYTVIYLKMLLLGLKNGGRIYYDGVEDSFADEIALELDEESENVRFCMLYLEKTGLLEKVSENEAFLTETPAMTVSESASAARMRKLRAGKASQCDAHVTPALRGSDKTVTLDIDIDIDTDTDTDTDTEMLAQSCDTAPAPEPAVYVFPCIKNQTYSVTQSQIDTWMDTYPNVDVELAIKRMLAWLDANPQKRKTANGCPRFINAWLGREQDSGKTPRREEKNNGIDESGFNAAFWNYGTV